jgi:hypothetical protein
MLIYCRHCLLEGSELADIPSYGTIHEGAAICLNHFRGVLEPVLAERIPIPMQEAGAFAGRPVRC